MAKHTFKENVMRVVAVLGLIAVLLLGAWGIIQLAFFIPGFLSNIAGGRPTTTVQQESLSVSAPLSVNSEQAFPLNWTHKNGSGQYSYTVSYACAEGLSVKAPLPTGALQTVACNTPFNYLTATNTMPIVATNSSDKAVTLNLTVAATKLSSGERTASGSANTSVAAAQKQAAKPTTTKKPTSTTKTNYVPSGRTTNLYGQSDLQVRMLSNPGSVRAGQLVQMQFVVENVGTNVSPSNWIFTSALPYNPTYTYQSPGQQALYPGDKIVYTLSFTAMPANTSVCTMQYPNYNCPTATTYPYDYTNSWSQPYSTMDGYYYNGGYPQQYPGYQYPGYQQTVSASVTVDPYNLIWETQEYNNTATITYSVF